MDATQISVEQWLPIPGYEGFYEVSNLGRVRSLDRTVRNRNDTVQPKRGMVLKISKSNRCAYMTVGLTRDNKHRRFFVHRLVLMAFVGPCPEGMEACHNNGVADDNRISNLRWDTPSENIRDLVRHGTHPHASKTHCIRGHLFDVGNTYLKTDGSRECRACRAVNQARYRARRRQIQARTW